MTPLRILSALLCATLLGACGHSVAVSPTPPAGLLQPCAAPAVPDPDKATDRDVATAILDLGQAYYDCKARYDGLSGWVKGLGK